MENDENENDWSLRIFITVKKMIFLPGKVKIQCPCHVNSEISLLSCSVSHLVHFPDLHITNSLGASCSYRSGCTDTLWGRISISRHNLSQGSSRRQPTMVMNLRLRCIKPLWGRFQTSCSELNIKQYMKYVVWNNSSRLPFVNIFSWTVDKRFNITESVITVFHCLFSCRTKNAEFVQLSNNHLITHRAEIPTGPRLCCLITWFQEKI